MDTSLLFPENWPFHISVEKEFSTKVTHQILNFIPLGLHKKVLICCNAESVFET